ncbi:MAG: FtsX-like permease family protein, partial [Bacteroidota bacterium]
RNIWRNRRRTLITAASIMFAVFFAVVMKSIQKAAWGKMLENILNYHIGYAQIMHEDYVKSLSIDDIFESNEIIDNIPTEVENITGLVPRLQSFALASNDVNTKGTLVIGVDPIKENAFTGLKDRITKGNYFSNDDEAVLIAEGLAEYLNVDVGDTLILISQGYHATNSAGKYEVAGLVYFPSPELNDQMLYLPLKQAQYFYGAENKMSSMIVLTDDPDELEAQINAIESKLEGSNFVIQDYEKLVPEIVEAKSFDEAGGSVVLSLLYIIIGFGIFGTLLMMIKEREYEFGILKAIGMNASKLNWMLWVETIILGIIGCIAGCLLALPVILYLQYYPIRFTGKYAEAYEKFGVEPVFPAALDFSIMFDQALVVFIMITIMSLYPLLKIVRLNPVKAMRS